MLQNRNLSVNDKKRLLLLATREIERDDTSIDPKEEEQKKEPKEDNKIGSLGNCNKSKL